MSWSCDAGASSTRSSLSHHPQLSALLPAKFLPLSLLQDENDNPPTFSKPSYVIAVMEDIMAGKRHAPLQAAPGAMGVSQPAWGTGAPRSMGDCLRCWGTG